MLFANLQRKYKLVPQRIRTLAIATSIRWMGWGMCEALIPTLYYKLTGSFEGAGLIATISATILLVFSVPAGILFDRASIRRVLMLGLSLFILSGLGYFITGSTNYLIVLMITEVFSGFSLIFDVIGRSAYIRTNAPPEQISSSYGFSDSWINGGTITGVIFGIILAQYISPYYLFLAVPPTTLITWFIFWKYLPSDDKPTNDTTSKVTEKTREYYRTAVRGLKRLNTAVYLLLFLLLFSTALFSVGVFYLPIHFFATGAGAQAIFLAFGVSNLPLVFSAYLGSLADGREYKTLLLSLTAATVILVALAYVSMEIGQLILVFILTLSTVLMNLSIEALITRKTTAGEYGFISSLVEAMKSIGPLLGPLVIGLSVGLFGTKIAFLLFSGLSAVIIVFIYSSKLLVNSHDKASHPPES